MNSSILNSTLLLTLLLLVGLLFFVRASVQDRTEQVTFRSSLAPETLLEQLQQHFVSRAYQIAMVNAEQRQLAFQGQVSASVGLALFLSLLAAVGLGCLALVLMFLFPVLGKRVFLGVVASPLAGLFYWRKANRLEQIKIQLENRQEPAFLSQQTQISVTAHRDEISQLKKAFSQQLQLID